MKTTLRIARIELNNLFYSPIAWFLLIALLIQCGIEYVGRVENLVTSQEMGGLYLRNVSNLTSRIFSSTDTGLLWQIVSYLYMYIPLLTMGLISREINSGTIKLLFSSPLKNRQIVLGKFIAMMVFNLVLLLTLALTIIFGVFNIDHPDIPLLLCGLLACYLLLCTYAAIGLFMSCLTSYQVVAAMSTFAIFALLNNIHTYWQNYDFFREITDYLSMAGRTSEMVEGLISTKDVCYYLIITIVFLIFSVFKLQGGRESGSRIKKAFQYVVVSVIALSLGWITSLPAYTIYLDVSARQVNTLTPNTQKIIKSLNNEPLEVNSYINLLDYSFQAGLPSSRDNDRRRWEKYLRFNPNINLKYIYYYDSVGWNVIYKQFPGWNLKRIAEKYADANQISLSRFKTPEEIKKIIDLRPESNRYVMQLNFKGRKTFLRLFNDPELWPSETETSASLKRLTTKLPKIAFLDGELERSPDKLGDRDYVKATSMKPFRLALINQGFDLITLSLKHTTIPSDITALVIADPKVSFEPNVLAKIQEFINAGGNLLIEGEPGKQSILNPLIAQLGVQMLKGTLVQESKDYAPNLILPHLTPFAGHFTSSLAKVFQDSLTISMPSAVGLSYIKNGLFHVEPLLLTDSSFSWNKINKLVLDSADIVYSPKDGDQKKSIPTALALSRKIHGKEQRIIITGDADFLSNAELDRTNVNTANDKFYPAILGWFTFGQFPIDTSRPQAKDNHLNLTNASAFVVRVTLMGIIPGILLVIGSIMLIRRKRK